MVNQLLTNRYTCGAQQHVEVSGEIVGATTFTARSNSRDMEDAAATQANTVIRKHGSRLALEYAKLGHPSLHVGQAEQQVVRPCGVAAEQTSKNSTTTISDPNGDQTPARNDVASAGAAWTTASSSLAGAAFVLLWW